MARSPSLFLSAIFVCFSISAQTDTEDRFLKFIENFEKPYKNGTTEYFHRLEIFKNNLQQIDKLNAAYKDGPPVYGVTQFSDLSPEEFKAQYLSDLKPRPRDTSLRFDSEKPPLFLNLLQQTKDPPTVVDWREKGVVSAVKNQEQCGACWAFAAAEVIESAYGIKYNTTAPNLSVQQLIDCSTVVGNRGCEGGDICVALSYANQYGITYESVYPLTDKDGTCHLQPGSKMVNIYRYNCMQLVGMEDLLISYLDTVGPLAAAVDATTWNNYVGGVIQFHCSNKINHAVEIVGYNMTGPVPYYIVRNSWGTKFGIDGYLYIKIGGNLCGIAEEVSDVFFQDG